MNDFVEKVLHFDFGFVAETSTLKELYAGKWVVLGGKWRYNCYHHVCYCR